MFDTVVKHTFELSGLGKAPFKFISYYTADTVDGCQHCGRPIKHVFLVRSTDGKTSKVGSKCVEKTGDAGLIDMIKAAQREERRRLKRLKEQAEYEKRQQAEREANGGLTNYELAECRLAQERQSFELAMRTAIETQKENADYLRDFKGGFRDAVANCLYTGNNMSTSMMRITSEILAKRFGRKGSAPYTAAYDRHAAELDAFYREIAQALANHPNWRSFS